MTDTRTMPGRLAALDGALYRQRVWLLEHFGADQHAPAATPGGAPRPLCRCWHCGKLVGGRALFVSRVDENGSTRRNNIRPACSDHASPPARG